MNELKHDIIIMCDKLILCFPKSHVLFQAAYELQNLTSEQPSQADNNNKKQTLVKNYGLLGRITSTIIKVGKDMAAKTVLSSGMHIPISRPSIQD